MAIVGGRARVVKIVVAWIVANLLIWVGAVVAFSLWLEHEIAEQYRVGYRTTTDGDTPMIPAVGFAIMLTVALIAANVVALLVIGLIRQRRVRRET